MKNICFFGIGCCFVGVFLWYFGEWLVIVVIYMSGGDYWLVVGVDGIVVCCVVI